jgi:hypothetical protein
LGDCGSSAIRRDGGERSGGEKGRGNLWGKEKEKKGFLWCAGSKLRPARVEILAVRSAGDGRDEGREFDWVGLFFCFSWLVYLGLDATWLLLSTILKRESCGFSRVNLVG